MITILCRNTAVHRKPYIVATFERDQEAPPADRELALSLNPDGQMPAFDITKPIPPRAPSWRELPPRGRRAGTRAVHGPDDDGVGHLWVANRCPHTKCRRNVPRRTEHMVPLLDLLEAQGEIEVYLDVLQRMADLYDQQRR